MKILMILESEFPSDTRVEKEALALTNDGHEVHLACYTFDKQKPLRDTFKEIKIYRKRITHFTYQLGAAPLVLPFYFLFWKKFIKNIYAEIKFDAIHIHDLPLSKIGYYFKRKHGTKLICDQHEFYSDWIVHAAHLNNGAGKLIKLFSNWKKYEKKYLPKADLIITIENPLKQIYINNYGIHEDRIISLPNTPEKKVFNEDNIDHSIKEKYKDYFVILYIGGISIIRGIDTILKSLPKISESIPNIKFVFAGKIYKNCDPILQAKKLGVKEYVEYLGYLDHKLMPSYINASNICVHIPPVLRQENDVTIASKIYQYAVMEKPIIVGQGKLLKEFINKYQIGLAIKESSSEDFANKVIYLYQNPEQMNKIRKNYKNIRTSFFWETTVKALLNSYKKLQNQ